MAARDSRSDALHRKQMSEPEYLEWLSEMLPALGDYAKEASQVLRRIAAEKRSLQPSAPASASGALPADARLVNAPYEPGKRVVGIVIDADRFRYMHEAIDWLRSMLAAAPLPAATATSERAVALRNAHDLIAAAVDACTYNSEEEADRGSYGLPPNVLIPMKVWLDHYRLLVEKSLPSETPARDTAKGQRELLDRAYKIMEMAGYRVSAHNQDHNNPIIAWMADARTALYGADGDRAKREER